MMRTSALVLGAILTAGWALAQQAPLDPPLDLPAEPSAEVGTVPQPSFDTGQQADDAVVQQPRFVRTPGAGDIEVTPLAPPGEPGAASAEVMPPRDQTAMPAAGAAVIDGDVDVLLQGRSDDLAAVPGAEDTIQQGRFKPAPGDLSRLTRPTGPAVPIDPPSTDFKRGVRLRELDKMTGQTETFELAVGEERQVDRLKIRLEACRSPEGNDTHGTMAFLKIWDIREPNDEAFSGWMFAESPSLSAMDHPRYDLWVISCTTSAVAASSVRE